MNKSLSKTSEPAFNSRALSLRSLISKSDDASGLLYDAKITNDIAICLYELRKQSGYTQKELAEKMNVKQSNISRWEKPGYQGYKVKMLSKLVRKLGGKLQINIEQEINYMYVKAEFNYHKTDRIHTIQPDGSRSLKESELDVTYKVQGIGVMSNASL